MKNLLMIIALLFTTTMFANKPPNTMRITTDKEHTQTFRLMGQALIKNGYAIKYSDVDMGMINTEEKQYNVAWGGLRSRLIIVVDGNMITMRAEAYNGDSRVTGGERIFRVATKSKRKNKTAQGRAWTDMEAIAKDIGGEIELLRVDY